MGEERVKDCVKPHNSISMCRAHPAVEKPYMMTLQLIGLYARCPRSKGIDYIVPRHLVLSEQVILSRDQNSGY